MVSSLSQVPVALKRLLVGRPFRSDRLGETLLSKRIALPVFASDAMSSVAYAPQEIFLVLSVAGLTAYAYTPWVALAVAVVLAVVVASYRQNVHAYPSGGGDYEVATVNLGPRAGLVVGSALLVDYVLTVAVSIASAIENVGSAVDLVHHHKVWFAVGAIVLLAAVNLRGLRESGAFLAIPTYLFIVSIVVMLAWGFGRVLFGSGIHAETADFGVRAEPGHWAGFAMVFLLARAFSSGCAALTGVEAISNGVPAFRKPKSRNAATTLLLLGAFSITLLMGLVLLAREAGVKYVANPATELTGTPEGYRQSSMIAQLAHAVVWSATRRRTMLTQPDAAAPDFMQWFHFRARGAAGVDCVFNIVNAGEASYVDGWTDYRACVSHDRTTWTRAATRYEDGVLVQVEATQGSAPREAGAWMAVWRDALTNTIGGGQLEYQAVAAARKAFPAWSALSSEARSAKLMEIPWGAETVLIGRTIQAGKNFWLQVRYNGQVGWIFAPYVSIRGDVNAVPIR